MDISKLTNKLDRVVDSQQVDKPSDATGNVGATKEFVEPEFVRVALVQGNPQIVDGPTFSRDKLIESVQKLMAEFSFKTPSDKNQFLTKICTAFGLPTTIATIEDAIDLATKTVPSDSIEIKSSTVEDTEWSDSNEDFE